MKPRTGIDRRFGEDRRTAYDLDYYFKIGVERRSRIERRRRSEQRKGWMRVTDWISVYVGSRRSLRGVYSKQRKDKTVRDQDKNCRHRRPHSGRHHTGERSLRGGPFRIPQLERIC